MPAQKLTNEIVDARLLDRNIKKLDDYVTCETVIRFQCLKIDCNCVWKTVPQAVFHGTGCPECAKSHWPDNDLVDKRLVGRDIKRVGNYIDTKTKIEWKCLKNESHKTWLARPSTIFNGCGCPECAKSHYLNNNIIDKKLEGKNIKRLNDYINAMTPIMFKCLVEHCNYEWKTAPSSIINCGTGCPSCCGNLPFTNKQVDEKLVGKNIQRVDDYIDSRTPIRFKCLVKSCNYEWKTYPGPILRSETDCPKCNPKFSKNENLVYDILIANNINVERQKPLKKIISGNDRKIRVDFYIDNTIIEYNGRQHYEPVCFGDYIYEIAEQELAIQQTRDQYLQQICAINNIRLIWIDGRKYTGSKLKKHIIEEIVPILKI